VEKESGGEKMNKEVDTKVYNPLNGKSGGEG